MVKGLICVTSQAQKSGLGTPMYSRPGKGTTASYLAFREVHETVEEELE